MVAVHGSRLSGSCLIMGLERWVRVSTGDCVEVPSLTCTTPHTCYYLNACFKACCCMQLENLLGLLATAWPWFGVSAVAAAWPATHSAGSALGVGEQ